MTACSDSVRFEWNHSRYSAVLAHFLSLSDTELGGDPGEPTTRLISHKCESNACWQWACFLSSDVTSGGFAVEAAVKNTQHTCDHREKFNLVLFLLFCRQQNITGKQDVFFFFSSSMPQPATRGLHFFVSANGVHRNKSVVGPGEGRGRGEIFHGCALDSSSFWSAVTMATADHRNILIRVC